MLAGVLASGIASAISYAIINVMLDQINAEVSRRLAA
jgi:hypothetical protein